MYKQSYSLHPTPTKAVGVPRCSPVFGIRVNHFPSHWQARFDEENNDAIPRTMHCRVNTLCLIFIGWVRRARSWNQNNLGKAAETQTGFILVMSGGAKWGQTWPNSCSLISVPSGRTIYLFWNGQNSLGLSTVLPLPAAQVLWCGLILTEFCCFSSCFTNFFPSEPRLAPANLPWKIRICFPGPPEDPAHGSSKHQN